VTDRTGFVVIGRNEGARLEQCLRSVLRQSKRVVYVDSASTDGSPELARSLGVPVVSLEDDGQLSAARGRNTGYAELSGSYPDLRFVQFIDGDCILQPEFVPAAVAFLQGHPHVGVVCGRRFEARPAASIYNTFCEHEWNTPVGEARECGGDALVRRAAFDEVGGYNGSLRAGEEPEMTARMRAAGWRIWRIDVAMTEHDANICTIGQWWRRAFRGGYGYAQVWTATKPLPQRLYGRNLRSAAAWTIGVPLVVTIAAILSAEPLVLLCLPLALMFQWMRIAHRSQGTQTERLVNAGLVMLAKIPETLGAARFLLSGDRRAFSKSKANG
jgi:glycosyltransferase involved in cell wall biosynthesis